MTAGPVSADFSRDEYYRGQADGVRRMCRDLAGTIANGVNHDTAEVLLDALFRSAAYWTLDDPYPDEKVRSLADGLRADWETGRL